MSRVWLATTLALALSVVALPAMAQVPGADVTARPDPAMICHVGVYRLADGTWVDVAPVPDTGLRWRRLDGEAARMSLNAEGLSVSTLGSTKRVEGPQPQLGTCDEGRITFESQTGARIELNAQDTTFVGQGGILTDSTRRCRRTNPHLVDAGLQMLIGPSAKPGDRSTGCGLRIIS